MNDPLPLISRFEPGPGNTHGGVHIEITSPFWMAMAVAAINDAGFNSGQLHASCDIKNTLGVLYQGVNFLYDPQITAEYVQGRAAHNEHEILRVRGLCKIRPRDSDTAGLTIIVASHHAIEQGTMFTSEEGTVLIICKHMFIKVYENSLLMNWVRQITC